MADYQQVVDEIRYALQSESCELTEELRNAAQEYSQACREVNQRLRKIGTYLDGGLRSEAIQLAEGPPNIEELVGLLNFPEQEEWADVVAIYDLPRNEPLMLRVIEQLSEAQVVELPLVNLLSRHRLLALHRAPLRLRLNVLRELQAADPETSSWEEDLRTFEKARFQEMAVDARSAQRDGNIATLKELQEDIAKGDWLETPPAKLVNVIRAGAAELTKKTAHRQLDELAVALEATFAELDFPRAKELAGRWKDALRRAGQGFQSPVIEQMAPILGWVQDEEAREAAERQYTSLVAQLEQELDRATEAEELDKLVHEIQRLDRDVPEVLAIRYQNRREAIQIGQSRTHRLQLGTAIAAIVAIAVGVGFLVRQQVRSNEAERVAKQVEELLDNHQLEDAQAILSKRNDVASWDHLTALQTRLDTDLKAVADHQSQFNNHFQIARESTTFRDVMEALQQAKLHAVTSEDKIAMSQLQREWERKHHEQMAARESDVSDSIRQVGEQLNVIDGSMGNGPGDDLLGSSLVQVASSIGQLQEQVHEMRPEFQGQVKFLEARRKELERLRQERLLAQQRMDLLTRSANITTDDLNPSEAVDRYRAALLAFADSIPQQQTAEIYRERATEEAFWKAALTWSKAVNSWEQIWPQDLTEMASRIAESKKFLVANPGAPDTAASKRYLDQLESIVSITGHVDGSGAGLQARMDRIFSSPLIGSSWCLKTKDGRVFYVPKKMTISTAGFSNLQYFVGYGSDDLDRQKTLKHDDFISPEAEPSASQLLGNFVKERLVSLQPSGWNAFCLELTAKILNNDDLNAFIKLDLLKRCLELSASGDVFLKAQLEPHLKLLQGASINPLARWMNPDDSDGKKATVDASQLLAHFRRLKDLEDVWKNADQQRAAFTISMRKSAVMIGWLQPGDRWTCHMTSPGGIPNSDLLVAFVPSAAMTSEWRTIGRLVNGEVQFNAGVNEFLAPGRPVFAAVRSSTDAISGNRLGGDQARTVLKE